MSTPWLAERSVDSSFMNMRVFTETRIPGVSDPEAFHYIEMHLLTILKFRSGNKIVLDLELNLV